MELQSSMSKFFLIKDASGNWNTTPPVIPEKIKNVNCHKFVLYAVDKITYKQMISEPAEQQSVSADFTFGELARSISDTPYTLIRNEDDLVRVADKCEIGKTYIGQIIDRETREMTHSFITVRETANSFTCFDKPGFKYPFAVSELNAILNFVNKDGEKSNRNQEWRFVPVEF